MEKIDKRQAGADIFTRDASVRSLRGKWLKAVLMILAGAVTVFACYQLINDRMNMDGATITVVACIIGLMAGTALIDRSSK